MRVDVVIIGSGFGGMAMAIEIQRRRLGSYVILEQADTLGGTWRDNTYPGSACDVRSELYHFSFAPWAWSKEYPGQSEILAYQQAVARRYGLLEHCRFNDGVASCVYDEPRNVWVVTTVAGASYEATYVVAATGQLNKPSIPDLPGRATFAGPQFHTARFDHDVDLTGQRVAIVGSGASAVQVGPAIVDEVEHLDVYQRSAPYVLPKLNPPTTAWRRARQRYLPWTLLLKRLRNYLMGEVVGSGLVGKGAVRAKARAQWEQYVTAVVRDPALREKIEPDYEIGCKRILLASDWYSTLQQDHVELVTTGIDHFTSDGIVTTDGVTHPCDVVVWATGFATTSFVAPIEVRGRDGRALADVWSSRPLAYRGVAVPGFPNFFCLYGPNTNLGSNSILFMLEAQTRYVASLLRAARDGRIACLDVRAARHEGWRTFIDEASGATAWLAGCTSWYQVDGVNTNNWPASSWSYHRLLGDVDLESYLPEPN